MRLEPEEGVGRNATERQDAKARTSQCGAEGQRAKAVRERRKRPTEASCAEYPHSWLPWVFLRHLVFGTVMHPELKRSIEHWDGRLESLPHYRGCQVFPGEAGVMPMRCTCGVTILAQRRLLKLPLYYLLRIRWHARCAIRRIHPVQRWKQQKGKQRKVCRWSRALARDWEFYRCAATNLYWCSSRTPKPTPTDAPTSDAECSTSEIHSGRTRLKLTPSETDG